MLTLSRVRVIGCVSGWVIVLVCVCVCGGGGVLVRV